MAPVDVSDGPPALPHIGSLNLSTVRDAREKAQLAGGDHSLETGEMLASPRAASEAMLMTPRTALGKQDAKRVQFVSADSLHGEGPVAIASNGAVHASIGINGKLALWDAINSKLLCQVTLQLPPELEKAAETKRAKELAAKPPKWLAFDCAGTSLGIHRPGVGLWLCKVQTQGEKTEVTGALMLGDGKMSEHFTFVSFSSTQPGLLAVGTDSGRIMLFDPKHNKLTAQKEGKHPGKHVAIVCGDWLRDGRLACASGERMKVSAPITIDPSPEWKSFAKFYIGGMTAKIPIQQVSTTKQYDSTPGFVAVSMGEPPYIAMTLGDKVCSERVLSPSISRHERCSSRWRDGPLLLSVHPLTRLSALCFSPLVPCHHDFDLPSPCVARLPQPPRHPRIHASPPRWLRSWTTRVSTRRRASSFHSTMATSSDWSGWRTRSC